MRGINLSPYYSSNNPATLYEFPNQEQFQRFYTNDAFKQAIKALRKSPLSGQQGNAAGNVWLLLKQKFYKKIVIHVDSETHKTQIYTQKLNIWDKLRFLIKQEEGFIQYLHWITFQRALALDFGRNFFNQGNFIKFQYLIMTKRNHLLEILLNKVFNQHLDTNFTRDRRALALKYHVESSWLFGVYFVGEELNKIHGSKANLSLQGEQSIAGVADGIKLQIKYSKYSIFRPDVKFIYVPSCNRYGAVFQINSEQQIDLNPKFSLNLQFQAVQALFNKYSRTTLIKNSISDQGSTNLLKPRIQLIFNKFPLLQSFRILPYLYGELRASVLFDANHKHLSAFYKRDPQAKFRFEFDYGIGFKTRPGSYKKLELQYDFSLLKMKMDRINGLSSELKFNY